jgi:DNA-binding transcriptional LysR family regulator
MIPVVAPSHPLAAYASGGARVASERFVDAVQIVLSERIEPSQVRGASARVDARAASAVERRLHARGSSARGARNDKSGEGVADQAVLSPRTWRVADLHTKHMMLRAGLGWGNLPEHLARDDLRTGKLLWLRPEAWGDTEHTLHLSAVYRSDTTFGPAHRWLLTQLALLCARAVEPPTRDAAPSERRESANARPASTRKSADTRSKSAAKARPAATPKPAQKS